MDGPETPPDRRHMRAIAAVLATLWTEIDLAVPYTAGELLARVRERGTIDLEYRERDVRIRGRVAPALAGELGEVARRWEAALAEDHHDPRVGAHG